MTPLDAPRFTGLDEQDSQLLIMVIEKAASEAADVTMSKYLDAHCREHQRRTAALESVVFGRAEDGICGLRECAADNRRRIDGIEASLKRWDDDRAWMRRTVIGAVAAACGSLLVSVLLAIINGVI